VAVIPARYQSSRLPGKALALIGGRPMVCHVAERTRRARGLGRVIVATDDARIRDAVVPTGVEVAMTRADHPTGTDRLAEAAAQLKLEDKAIVVNVQGDEPLLEPALIREVAEELRAHKIRVAVVCPGSVHTEFGPHSGKNPERMLQPDDVAHVVEMLVTQAPQSFASEVVLRPTLKP